METLVVNEIFLSVQGESTFAGLPCVFIRLTACNLRCAYCDTAYAFKEGRKMTWVEIGEETLRLARSFAPGAESACAHTGSGGAGGDAIRLPIVEVTGGEPLLQRNSLPLMAWLCEQGLTVLIETNGALDISPIDPRVRRIMDLKCPSSGEAARNRWENISHLKASDEVKFVIGTAQDYEWAKGVLREHRLAGICPVLFSWVEPLTPRQQDGSLKPAPADHQPITRVELAERILKDGLPVRFQVQLHKVIWPPEARGV